MDERTGASIKRNTAYKFRIGDLLRGTPILNNERLSFLEIVGKRVLKVNVIANVIEKFESEGEKKYAFLTIDDASGQIRAKAFGEDVGKMKNIVQGQTIVIIGNLRYFNKEIYISPEIIKPVDPSYLLIRKLEIEKSQKAVLPQIKKEGITALKDNLIQIIKQAEENEGIEIDRIIMRLRDSSPQIINQEIRKLLEEGIIFEPRPGKVRWMG